MTTVRDVVGAVAPARRASLSERVLVDWLELHLALEGRLDHDSTASWKHRSVYELVAVHGRWFTPAALPAEVQALPERQCFANAAATEQKHPHLAYTEGFAVADGSPVPTAHAWYGRERLCDRSDLVGPRGQCVPGNRSAPDPAAARAPQREA